MKQMSLISCPGLITITLAVIFAAAGVQANADQNSGSSFEKDIFESDSGNLEITFIGHGTLMFSFGGMVIHADPWTRLADYQTLPKADIILITHEHRDHLDLQAIEILRKDSTEIVMNPKCAEKVSSGRVMKNGDVLTVKGLKIEAVPAYNIVHKRDNGEPFHPGGSGNGYILHFGSRRIYVAGDTENIPEMKDLGKIDIAFLPMNLPYTMTPEMLADAANSVQPAILYPYHFGDSDTSAVAGLIKGKTEVRIRKMK